MLKDRIEGKWLDAFAKVFALSNVKAADPVAILSETQSREINVHLVELALLRLGAKPFHVVLPTPPQTAGVPIRSTGASTAVQGIKPVVSALKEAVMVADCTVEGMMHARETPEILKAGGRILYIANDHPELLERLVPNLDLKAKVQKGIAKLRRAREMRVTSDAGTDLRVKVEGAPSGGGWGFCADPGKLDHWPGGLVLCFPKSGSVNGTLVMDRGDINLTFKRYLETPVRLTVAEDFVTDIDGDGLDAELMKSYFEVWGERNAYAVSHVGWGMNQRARWDAMTMYDRGDHNGVEQRAFGGNFLYSTGANEFADRFTLGHFDLPIRNCTISLDNERVVDKGRLIGELA
jgi:2,5-dihydroxypyridine 5,6-dioxygenase